MSSADEPAALGVAPPPGSPDGLQARAAALRRRAAGLGAELGRLERAGRATWVGAAATDYGRTLRRSTVRIRLAAEAHRVAATVVDEHATVLGDAQRRGARLAERASVAHRQGDHAELAALRREAERLRAATDAAAERAAHRLDEVRRTSALGWTARSATAEAAARQRADLRKIYRRRLHSDGSRYARRRLRELARAPAKYHRRVARSMRGTDQGGIYVGAGPITGLGYSSSSFDQPPRGWPPGTSWADVPGVFDPAGPALLLGTGAHGSTNLALHEFGHAADAALGSPSQGKVFGRLHDEIDRRVRLDPYYTQPGGAGEQEFFAEAFAWRYGAGGHETFQGSRPAATLIRRYFDRLEGSL